MHVGHPFLSLSHCPGLLLNCCSLLVEANGLILEIIDSFRFSLSVIMCFVVSGNFSFPFLIFYCSSWCMHMCMCECICVCIGQELTLDVFLNPSPPNFFFFCHLFCLCVLVFLYTMCLGVCMWRSEDNLWS